MGRNLTTDQKARIDAALVLAYGDAATWTVPCVWCGVTVDALDGDMERDRIVPGDAYTYGNVLPACRGCNGDRGDSTTGEWSDDARLYGPAAGIGCPAAADWKALREARRRRAGAAALERAARRAAARGR